MKRHIFISVFLIVCIAVAATGATYAFFSDVAEFNDATYATGTLDIRLNAEESIGGFQYGPAAPGDIASGSFTVNNYGPPWFSAGQSNLSVKELVISAEDLTPNALADELMVRIEANRGWPDKMLVFEGKLKDLTEKDLLGARWTELAPGESEDVYYSVWLPNTPTSQNALMGSSATFDFQVGAYNPAR